VPLQREKPDRRSDLSAREVLSAWGRVLSGRLPLLSIEITRECPLSCPGCYAFGESHLGGEVTLRDLADKRGDALVDGVLGLVRQHKPLHVSLVGGEPFVRHRELSRILPALSEMGVFSLVVTSAVIPITAEWITLPRVRIAVSIDGLPEHHDARRKPATYERILKNIAGREVNVHWTITRPMLSRSGYLEEYVSFWNARPEVNRIWISVYTPQIGERSAEILTTAERRAVAGALPGLAVRYPKLVFNRGLANALLAPPKNPQDCLFSKMSANYSADLQSRVEPCVFGGSPDCSQCGCAISSGLHSMRSVNVAGPLHIGHFVEGSIAAGRFINRLRSKEPSSPRWHSPAQTAAPSLPFGFESTLVQIEAQMRGKQPKRGRSPRLAPND
jgi:sulfatase maturation enzyme AslB (radical SAM superfamily)